MNETSSAGARLCESQHPQTGATRCDSQSRAPRYFFTLSILWLFPSAGACWIIGTGFQKWFSAGSFAAGLAAVKFEEWIALGLLLAQLLFILLALRFRRRRKI